MRASRGRFRCQWLCDLSRRNRQLSGDRKLARWLNDTEVVGIVARFPRVATGQVDRLGMYRQLDINLREPRSQLLYEIAMPLEPAHDLGLGPNRHRRILS